MSPEAVGRHSTQFGHSAIDTDRRLAVNTRGDHFLKGERKTAEQQQRAAVDSSEQAGKRRRGGVLQVKSPGPDKICSAECGRRTGPKSDIDNFEAPKRYASLFTRLQTSPGVNRALSRSS